VETAEVIKTDSSRVNAKKSNDQLIFPELKPGDAILLIYTLKNYYPGNLVYHFWDKHIFVSNTPCLENTYSLLISPQVKFSHRLSNGGFDPVKKDGDNFDLYIWTSKDIAASRSEKYMTPYVGFNASLFTSSF